jgi:polyribonucleotide nucleotidyltransferase
VKDFGAFIEIKEGQDGLCHISELSDSYVKSVNDVVKIGDIVKVKVIAIDEQGRVKLSRKAAMVEAAEE